MSSVVSMKRAVWSVRSVPPNLTPVSPPSARLDVTGRPVEPRAIDLDTFFAPKTVAVIGASDDRRRPNAAMTSKIRQWAEQAGAEDYLVMPQRDKIGGLKSYQSIADVPADVDLAAILVGDAVPALEDVIEKKAKFAVVFAAGFAEVGAKGERLQARREERIAGGDARVWGANTNLNGCEVFRDERAGKAIALVTQSGHEARPVVQVQGIVCALRDWASAGNER